MPYVTARLRPPGLCCCEGECTVKGFPALEFLIRGGNGSSSSVAHAKCGWSSVADEAGRFQIYQTRTLYYDCIDPESEEVPPPEEERTLQQEKDPLTCELDETDGRGGWACTLREEDPEELTDPFTLAELKAAGDALLESVAWPDPDDGVLFALPGDINGNIGAFGGHYNTPTDADDYLTISYRQVKYRLTLAGANLPLAPPALDYWVRVASRGEDKNGNITPEFHVGKSRLELHVASHADVHPGSPVTAFNYWVTEWLEVPMFSILSAMSTNQPVVWTEVTPIPPFLCLDSFYEELPTE